MTKAITTRYTVRREKAGHVATDGDGNSVFVQQGSNDVEGIEDRHCAAALALCVKMNWKGKLAGAHLLKGGKTVGMVWVWTDAATAIRTVVR